MNAKLFLFFRSEKCWRYLLSIVMSAIFITAGVMKLADPAAFAQDILRFRLLSEDWSTYVASGLPWLELMIGIAVFNRRLRLSASFLIFGLMGVFTFAVAIALVRGLDISCGCFGKAFEEYATSGVSFLLRDFILLFISAVLFWLTVRRDGCLADR